MNLTGTTAATAGADTTLRWSGVGTSTKQDSRTAGVEAARAARSGDDPKLFVAFAGHRHDHPALLAGIGDVAGEVPVIGCTTGGEIGVAGPTDDGVVVMAIGGPGIDVATRTAVVHDGDLRSAGAAAARLGALRDHRPTMPKTSTARASARRARSTAGGGGSISIPGRSSPLASRRRAASSRA